MGSHYQGKGNILTYKVKWSEVLYFARFLIISKLKLYEQRNSPRSRHSRRTQTRMQIHQ